MKRVFDDDYDINRIIMNINIEAQLEITPEDSLIIFDEIRDAPRALESLKYFCENAPEYAGSLLGVAIHNGVSYPVGKVDQIYLSDFRDIEVRQIQNRLLFQYEDDLGKHAGGSELLRIRMV